LQSIIKLFGRNVIPTNIAANDVRPALTDPMTRFACVLAALVHDVGHLGVPNTQLVLEKHDISMHCNGQSPAEQNSLEIGWALLMKPEYSNLRRAIYCDETEMRRFRFLLVHAVMATDIEDTELKQSRKLSWQQAFPSESNDCSEVSNCDSDTHKALVAIQTLMQVSDVSHTMQHWEVYRKWNEKLFAEYLAAFQAGRSDADPALCWCEGELTFFDHCVIPLAQKLKECGVFGVSSDEYMNYALKNRGEWEATGIEVTRAMVAKVTQGGPSK
jgi:3'5'-cyclic nucleotide phosphodiesterase